MAIKRCFWLGLALVSGWLRASAEQVVLSEIHYHPREGLPEYLEIYNNTATPFDIAGWRLSEGVDYRFPDFNAADPQRTFLKPFERIVLGGVDEAALRAGYAIPATVRVFGPWSGNLSNGGERVTLEDKNGVVVCTVSYGDRDPWPVAADGAGHSLVLRNPDRSIDDWRNWTFSTRPGGTPGSQSLQLAETPVPNPEIRADEGIPFVDYSSVWRYHDEGINLGTAWRARTYDDSGWNQGPGLLGFEDAALPPPGLQTSMNDVDQLTYYLRTSFDYAGALEGASLMLDQILDDGAVYYLNGIEIGRSGMPSAPTAISFTTAASRTVGDATEELDVFPIDGSVLRDGENVLAVEVHQVNTTSSDVVFGARLRIAVPSQSGVVINEVLPGGTGQGFVEFFNPGATEVDLDGYHLSDDPGELTRFRIDGSAVVPAGGFASMGFSESNLRMNDPVAVYLVAPDGGTVVNALSGALPGDGRSLGRKPAGGDDWFWFADPTRDAPNLSVSGLAESIRLNEAHFSSSNTVDWVELHNRGTESVSLEGLALASSRDFADSVPLAGTIGAGNYASLETAFPVQGGEVTLYLVSGAGTVLDARVVESIVGRPSMQAYPDGGGEWYSAETGTRDAANDPPRFTDVVINEIHFDPPSDQIDGEFVELFNRGGTAVDVSGWRLSEGVGFRIPDGTSIPAGGFLVIAADAARLREVYGEVPVMGDFEGRLSNRGERLRLVDAWGNLADEVDYRSGGDWPFLAKGRGSSMELVHPSMDNSLSSAWLDSNETAKAPLRSYSYTGTYEQLRADGLITDHRELHLHLLGDAHVVLENIQLRLNGTGPNLISNGAQVSENGSGGSGWLCQGTHWASYAENGRLHLISDGRGDNRANRAEIDVTGLSAGETYQLSFNARWVYGIPRLVAQTWDHSIAHTFYLEVPENSGTPGAMNSRFREAPAPQVDGLRHAPAVPRASDPVRVTVRVVSAAPLADVRLFHRPDNSDGNASWVSKLMYDDGVNGGDETAGDGIYTATLTEHQVNGRIVQFYARARTAAGEVCELPRQGMNRPAMYVVDDRVVAGDLRTARFVVSEYDLGAISNGETSKYGYRFPRLSNHYYNATFISNEEDIFYNAEIRNSGSPWTRGGSLNRGKWKLPEDRLFRGHDKLTFDNDASGGNRHHNRFTRHLLYLLGHPVNENEFVRYIINSGGISLREEVEPVGNHLLDRNFPNGSKGDLYRIDDEWWFRDDWSRSSRDADWSYKGTELAGRYRTEWMKRSNEVEDDFSALIAFFQTVAQGRYSQEEIERLIDPEASLKMAAVRGYIGDWDSFTLDRGKNMFFYRRADDGRFQFLHWDSDLAFRSGQALYGRHVQSWLERSYNLRLFYSYLRELLENYTRNSPRMEAWFEAEEQASSAYTIDAAFYRNWFASRESFVLSAMGANASVPFEITTNGGNPLTTGAHQVLLSGRAPYGVFTVEVDGHPEAVLTWTAETIWTLSGILLREGENPLTLIARDLSGGVLAQDTLTVNKTGNAPPVVALDVDPGSLKTLIGAGVALDARGSFDPEGGELAFEWSVSPEAGALLVSDEVGRANIAFQIPGLFVVTVSVTDSEGLTAGMSREIAVYGPGGFSSFGSERLEPHWNSENVDPRDNHPVEPWLTLTDYPGELVIQVPEDIARPVGASSPAYPFLWRALSAEGDWLLQTEVRLAGRQSGRFHAGLMVEILEGGESMRYGIAMENGSSLAVMRIDSAGVVTHLTQLAHNAASATLRIRKAGATLRFDRYHNEVWGTIHTRMLSGEVSSERGGIFVATSVPQSVRGAFDFALLVDPQDTSELRQFLRVSELMYNPVGGDAFEFVELVNLSTGTLDLTGVRFVDGIDFTFGAEMLEAGERIVVVKDPVAFVSRYGNGPRVAVGVYGGVLANGGETLTLVDAEGALIQSFTYGDSGDWPGRADGDGSSLEAIQLFGDYEDPANWRASSEYLGSPGSAGIGPLRTVVINEVLTHSDPPLEDAIELRNLTDEPIAVGGWFLSDDRSVPGKFRIPDGTVISARGYLVFYEQEFNAGNPLSPFALSSARGEEVCLMSADAAGNLVAFVDAVEFGPAENGVSFGRYPDGTGQWVTLSRRTLGEDEPESLEEFRRGTGLPNARPRVGPVVISEIMYHPPGDMDEYLELRNITDAPVPLFDPLHATNTWRFLNGIDFVFPGNVTMAAQGTLYVTGIDPAIFRAQYNVPASIPVFGPFGGRLDNAGERIALFKPDPPDPLSADGLAPYVLVESIRYDDAPPWPVEADGTGPSLIRVALDWHGNDPWNWSTQAIDPGADSDDDGLPDWWEWVNGLDPFNAADADLDADGDRQSNLAEWESGTLPRDGFSALRVEEFGVESGGLVLRFTAETGMSYTVLRSETLGAEDWTRVTDVTPLATTKRVKVMDPMPAGGARYYRVVTPAVP